MDHNLLRQFVAAAHHLHFAHAAKALNVPRSTVVASVRTLEEMLGYDLFDRGATATVLTPEGAAFLVDAERQLNASARAAAVSAPKPGGKAKASKGKGRAPAVKGERKPGRRTQGR
jgi:DNA-binding transcriptional LysR family regulator